MGGKSKGLLSVKLSVVSLAFVLWPPKANCIIKLIIISNNKYIFVIKVNNITYLI